MLEPVPLLGVVRIPTAAVVGPAVTYWQGSVKNAVRELLCEATSTVAEGGGPLPPKRPGVKWLEPSEDAALGVSGGRIPSVYAGHANKLREALGRASLAQLSE